MERPVNGLGATIRRFVRYRVTSRAPIELPSSGRSTDSMLLIGPPRSGPQLSLLREGAPPGRRSDLPPRRRRNRASRAEEEHTHDPQLPTHVITLP